MNKKLENSWISSPSSENLNGKMDYDINQSQQVTEILTDSEDKTVKILDGKMDGKMWTKYSRF